MNRSESSNVGFAQGLFILLFAGLVWLTTKLAEIDIQYVRILAITLLMIGIPCFLTGAIVFGRYKDVYDYEPANFLGRASTGKEVRGKLARVMYLGFFCTMSGGIMLFLLQADLIR